MKRALTYIVGIIALAIGLVSGSALAQTTANGPYYANPSWDQTLPSNTRFIVLSNFSSNAVLDRETGLVWEKSPSTISFGWKIAQDICNGLSLGNRKGWRLPTVQELASLVDPSVAPPGPTLPGGNPFTNVQTSDYWTATSQADSPVIGAWVVRFNSGVVTDGANKSDTLFFWCVRGGQGVDAQ